MLPRALGCSLNSSGGQACDQVISRSEVHWLTSHSAENSGQAKAQGQEDAFTNFLSPHPASTGLANKPNFVIPSVVTWLHASVSWPCWGLGTVS